MKFYIIEIEDAYGPNYWERIHQKADAGEYKVVFVAETRKKCEKQKAFLICRNMKLRGCLFDSV